MKDAFTPPIDDAMDVLHARLEALELRLAVMQLEGIPDRPRYRKWAAEWLMLRAGLEIGALIRADIAGKI